MQMYLLDQFREFLRSLNVFLRCPTWLTSTVIHDLLCDDMFAKCDSDQCFDLIGEWQVDSVSESIAILDQTQCFCIPRSIPCGCIPRSTPCFCIPRSTPCDCILRSTPKWLHLTSVVWSRGGYFIKFSVPGFSTQKKLGPNQI